MAKCPRKPRCAYWHRRFCGRPMSKGTNHQPLAAKFQIGSTHGRMEYDLDETVFHHSSVPEKAKLARQQVESFKRNRTLVSDRPRWDNSTTAGHNAIGGMQVAWDRGISAWENKVYKRVEAARRVQEAQDAYIQKRIRGPTPDEPFIRQRWNVSEHVDIKDPPSVHHKVTSQEMRQVQQELRQSTRMYDYRNRPSLVDRQTHQSMDIRRKKEERRRLRVIQEAHDTSTLGKGAWSKYPDDPFAGRTSLSGHSRDDLGQSLEQTYNRDTLARFLAKQEQQKRGQPSDGAADQENDDETFKRLSASVTNASSGVKPKHARQMQPVSNFTHELQRARSKRLGHKELQERLMAEPDAKGTGVLPKDPSSMLPVSTNTHELNQMKQNVLKKSMVASHNPQLRDFVHDGVWQYNKFDDEEQWSCCANNRFESKGCAHRVRKGSTSWNFASA